MSGGAVSLSGNLTAILVSPCHLILVVRDWVRIATLLVQTRLPFHPFLSYQAAEYWSKSRGGERFQMRGIFLSLNLYIFEISLIANARVCFSLENSRLLFFMW